MSAEEGEHAAPTVGFRLTTVSNRASEAAPLPPPSPPSFLLGHSYPDHLQIPLDPLLLLHSLILIFFSLLFFKLFSSWHLSNKRLITKTLGGLPASTTGPMPLAFS